MWSEFEQYLTAKIKLEEGLQKTWVEIERESGDELTKDSQK
jgi:hypothetical protein